MHIDTGKRPLLFVFLCVCVLHGCDRPVRTVDAPVLHPYQSLWTNHGSNFEYLTIHDKAYLAVANWFDGRSHDIDSKVYEWDGKAFQEAMNLPVKGVNRLHSFQLDDNVYLVATYYESSFLSLLKWQGTGFVEYQRIDLPWARDASYFSIDGRHYLAVGSYYDTQQKTNGVNSKIYKWDGQLFVEYQSLPTQGASRLESFVISGDVYLAVANSFNGKSHNIDSKIYKWDGRAFVEFESFPTRGAVEWKAFEIDHVMYLAVANNYDNRTHNVSSVIYKWNGKAFAEFQTIPTLGAASWEVMTVSGQIYLAVANHYDSTYSSYNTNSRIYKWTGEKFRLVQDIPSHCATGWKQFRVGDRVFLALTNAYDGTSYHQQSVIYEASNPSMPTPK